VAGSSTPWIKGEIDAAAACTCAHSQTATDIVQTSTCRAVQSSHLVFTGILCLTHFVVAGASSRLRQPWSRVSDAAQRSISVKA
jgi:hypothetical protein